LATLIVLFALVIANSKWILKTIYPIHYSELIQKYSLEYMVDPYLVAAIIKNESKFNPNALSRKDAKGLMQIAPITGRWASEMLDIENYEEEQLYEPELNIRIGIWYINVLNNEFEDNLSLVVAAYNAGNGNVAKWLQNPEYSIDGKELTVIPFPETRIYSRRVLRDYQIYQRLYRSGRGLMYIYDLWEIMSIYFRSLDI
jgi:soluble lytic murein transglycosylase